MSARSTTPQEEGSFHYAWPEGSGPTLVSGYYQHKSAAATVNTGPRTLGPVPPEVFEKLPRYTTISGRFVHFNDAPALMAGILNGSMKPVVASQTIPPEEDVAEFFNKDGHDEYGCGVDQQEAPAHGPSKEGDVFGDEGTSKVYGDEGQPHPKQVVIGEQMKVTAAELLASELL